MEYELGNILTNHKESVNKENLGIVDVNMMTDKELEAEIKKEIDKDYDN